MLMIVTILAMIGCDFFGTLPETTTATTITTTNQTTTQRTTTSETLTTETPYEGPLFLAVSATNYIPDEIIYLSNPQSPHPHLLTHRVGFDYKQTLIHLNQTIATYYTTKLAKEYLVVEIQQPEAVQDQYVISSITLSYPGGTQIKWTNSTTEPGGTRQWYSNYSNTLFYIPFTAPSSIHTSGYTYQVLAIQYIDGVLNKDVRFASEAVDQINVFVEKSHITAQGSMMAEYWPDEEKIVLHSFSNTDNAVVTEVYINDVLQFCEDTVFQSGDTIYIVNPFTSFADHFVTVTVVYDNGLGIMRSVTGLAITVGSYPDPYYYLPIYTIEQLNKIPRDYIAQITLSANITLPSDFEPFTGYTFNIVGNGRTLNVPEEVTFWEYDGDPYYLEMFEQGSINMRNCTINGKIRLANYTLEPYILFTHAGIEHFTLINISLDDLNNL